MVEIKRYTPSAQQEWDTFIDSSRNGTFLFKRAYMDYHSDRFNDHSLMFYDGKGRLIAVLPANITTHTNDSCVLYSHQGLTYGGIVLSEKTTTEMVISLFQSIKPYLREIGVRSLYYKQIPTCYHRYPSEEDEYALWRMGAELTACNISTTIALRSPDYTIPLERCRKYRTHRATKLEYTLCQMETPDVFWPIMVDNLRKRYGVSPVHSLGEMQLLMRRFPEEIRCFTAQREGKAEAGIILYLTTTTVHVQYAHATPKGKTDGALDLLYSSLIEHYRETHSFFDFGTSNEDGGRILNSGLIAQKEGFGGRGIAYKQWKLNI